MKHLEPEININLQVTTRIESIKKLKKWLIFIANKEKKNLSSLTYTLVSDLYLLKMNQEILNHDYLTDIITFDLSDKKYDIEGDIYISYDRVKENARVFHVKQMEELRRVFAHGLLHLIGYKDKEIEDIKTMRKKEDYYLNKYNTIYK